MKHPLERLRELAQGYVRNPRSAAIAGDLLVELALLQARQVQGENVARELQHLRSQASSLTAIEGEATRQAWLAWIQEWGGALITGALASVGVFMPQPPHRGRRGGQPLDARETD